MKADLPLSERKRIQEDDGREIRAALVARHFDVLDERRAIEVAELANTIRQAPVYRALADRMRT
jgi:hypothetical protein